MVDLERIFPATLRPFTELDQFGIAVRLNQSGEPHVGVLYRTADDSVRLLHLAWQDDLRSDVPSTSYYWGHASLDTLNQRFLAILAEKVAQNLAGQMIDWGWSYAGGPDAPISPEGTWATAERKAMTCATFVLALFVSHGIQLVRPETWPQRDEDQEWARNMLSKLNGSSDHINTLNAEIPSITRIRPFEVVVAVTGVPSVRPPFAFQHVEPHSKKLDTALCGG